MNAERNDGGPAFPLEVKNDDGTYFAIEAGMSKREYMATAILAGIAAREEFAMAGMAQDAVKMADALLLELAKP